MQLFCAIPVVNISAIAYVLFLPSHCLTIVFEAVSSVTLECPNVHEYNVQFLSKLFSFDKLVRGAILSDITVNTI